METFHFETYLLALKKAKTDNEKFAALLMVAKVTKESACNKEVKKQILEAVGPKFFSRLLKTKSVPEGCPENIYKSVAMSILSALSGDPDVACSSVMLENVTAFNMIILLNPSVSEDDTQLVDDTYECLNSLCQTTEGQDALVKAKTLSALSQAIVEHMYSSQKAVQLLISILSSTGSHAWSGCEPALNALMGHIAEDFKNEMNMKKFELCKTLIFLLTTMPRHIVKNVDPPWAHQIVTGLDRILRSKLGSCQREPALKLTAMLIDVCGVQCVLPPAVTDSKLFLLITHLCCVEVRMVLEDSDIKLAFQKGRLLSSCYSILETVINHMTGGPSLELDSRQVLQLHSALVGAFSAVLYFLRRVDEDRTIQWDSVVLATVRVLAAWLSEETSAVRNEVYQLIPFIVEISKKCVPPSKDFFQAKALSEKTRNTNENSSPRENNCDNYVRTRNTEVVMDSLSETLDTALDIVKPSDKKVVLDKDKTNGSKVEISDNHESHGTEEVQDSETSLEKVSQVSESQNNTHNIDLDENSNTKSSDIDEKTDLINVQNSDERDDKGDGEKDVSFNLNQNSIPDHLTCTEQLECCDLENKNMISNHDGHSEEMQADDSSQTYTTETVDSKSALALASADSKSAVSVIDSAVKAEQVVNNSENNQNEATILKTESVIKQDHEVTIDSFVNDSAAGADAESTVSVINSVVKTEQEVNNSENNQNEATIAKTESVNIQNEATIAKTESVNIQNEATIAKTESVNIQNEATIVKTESVIKQDHEVTIDPFVNDSAAGADSESTVSVINNVVKTEQEVNNSENNQNEATLAKTESVIKQDHEVTINSFVNDSAAGADSESTVSVINSVVKTEQEVNNSENNQNEATLVETESVIKQDHEVMIDSFVNDSAVGADAEMSEEELQDLHLRVDIFRFLLPGLCHLTSEDISRSVLIQEGILALLDLYMWRQWNLFNQDPQNKEIQSSLVILCNIFLNLVIIEPKLVVEREEFCHVLLLVVKGIKELELEGNYLVLWSHMATIGLMLLRALSKKTDSFLELESINRFFVSAVRFLSGAYTVEFKKKLATGLTVSEGYRQSWDQVSQTWFLSMQAFCSCVPLYSILPSVILKSGWIPALTKSLIQAKGRGVEEETRSCFLMLLTTVTKSDKSTKDLVMEKGGDEIARMYKSKDLTEALNLN